MFDIAVVDWLKWRVPNDNIINKTNLHEDNIVKAEKDNQKILLDIDIVYDCFYIPYIFCLFYRIGNWVAFQRHSGASKMHGSSSCKNDSEISHFTGTYTPNFVWLWIAHFVKRRQASQSL